jgi:metal-responsive CopG/Arc/MetJ family transcriptional regulator
VQLDDQLVALLDERVAEEGTNCSELLRRFVRAALAQGVESRIDEAIREGYRRIPAEEPSELVNALAGASIEAEPW